MIYIFCGDRKWADEAAIEREVKKLDPNLDIVRQGMCRGADLISRKWAKYYKIPCQDFPADWNLHGQKAGPIRNNDMLFGLDRFGAGRAQAVKAFHTDLSKSKGTMDMVTRAWRAGLPVEVFKK